MAAEDKRNVSLQTREQLIQEVTGSIENLGRTLDYFQLARVEEELPEEHLAEVRRELEQGLEVARNVQQRRDELERELRISE